MAGNGRRRGGGRSSARSRTRNWMELREILSALRASWWLPVAGLVLGGSAALVLSLLTTPLYTARTQLFVSATAADSASDVFQGSQFSQQRVKSYTQLLMG